VRGLLPTNHENAPILKDNWLLLVQIDPIPKTKALLQLYARGPIPKTKALLHLYATDPIPKTKVLLHLHATDPIPKKVHPLLGETDQILKNNPLQKSVTDLIPKTKVHPLRNVTKNPIPKIQALRQLPESVQVQESRPEVVRETWWVLGIAPVLDWKGQALGQEIDPVLEVLVLENWYYEKKVFKVRVIKSAMWIVPLLQEIHNLSVLLLLPAQPPSYFLSV
jgi:hypothetical protein